MTLLVSPTTYILASLHSHTSHTSHISRITTLPHTHLAWEFEKPFIISFINTPRFIQLKINELLILDFIVLSDQLNSHPSPLLGDICLNKEKNMYVTGTRGPGPRVLMRFSVLENTILLSLSNFQLNNNFFPFFLAAGKCCVLGTMYRQVKCARVDGSEGRVLISCAKL